MINVLTTQLMLFIFTYAHLAKTFAPLRLELLEHIEIDYCDETEIATDLLPYCDVHQSETLWKKKKIYRVGLGSFHWLLIGWMQI